MPRPFDHELRSHFEATSVAKKSRCRHCASEILNHAGSLKRHLNEFCKEYTGSQYRGDEVAVSRRSRPGAAAEALQALSHGGHPAAGATANNTNNTSTMAFGSSDPRLLSSMASPSGDHHHHHLQTHAHGHANMMHTPPRKAQQQARKKQALQIRSLEQQVLGLQGEVQRLRRENDILRGRQAHVQHVVASWSDFTGFGLGSGGGVGGGGGGDVGAVAAAEPTPRAAAAAAAAAPLHWGAAATSGRSAPARGGTADAPGDIDHERHADNDAGEGAVSGSRNSPLFTP